MQQLIEQFCAKDNLSTYDPYDVWKTWLGFHVKDYFNCHRNLGLLVAAPLGIFDNFVNNRARLFYTRKEYPIVRALAALSLLNLYQRKRKSSYLEFAKKHLHWLVDNSCKDYSGYCWGLQFDYPVSCGLIYDSNTPFSTMTPYPLEAFILYTEITGDTQFKDIIKSIFNFYENDIKIMEETDCCLATSYVPMRDRIVINAVSYTMYSLCILLPYIPESARGAAEKKIKKLYAYIRKKQCGNGSWLYSPEGGSFIDCFHTCIVIKNIIKTNRIVRLSGSEEVVKNGYGYLKGAFFDEGYWLFRRFSLKNKPSIVKFDLYDNAEVLNLGILLGDDALVDSLSNSISRYFCRGNDVYSQLDVLSFKRNKNMLRWAVMPYVYALSQID